MQRHLELCAKLNHTRSDVPRIMKEMGVIGPNDCDEKIANRIAMLAKARGMRRTLESAGGCSSKTRTVMRTANTQSENMVSRSGDLRFVLHPLSLPHF
jgi:hypothetical protein